MLGCFADSSYLTNDYLDSKIDWAPGMKDMRLKDFPSFIRTTDPNDIAVKFVVNEVSTLPKGRALILNTSHNLEQDALDAIAASQPHIYTVGPLNLIMNQIQNDICGVLDTLRVEFDSQEHCKWCSSNLLAFLC